MTKEEEDAIKIEIRALDLRRAELMTKLISEKRCPKCGEMRDLQDFYINLARRDGRDHYCRLCRAALSLAYAQGHKEERRAYAKHHNSKNTATRLKHARY